MTDASTSVSPQRRRTPGAATEKILLEYIELYGLTDAAREYFKEHSPADDVVTPRQFEIDRAKVG